MKNDTNIYDIDGELLRAAGDNHVWSIEEAKERVQHYQDKLKDLYAAENPSKEDLQKIKIYETYCKNLMNYEWKMLMSMDKDHFTEYLASQTPDHTNETTQNEVEKALTELKDDIETGNDIENEVSGPIAADNESNADEEPGVIETIERSGSGVQEKRAVSQSDLLVERDDVTPTVMDEYVSPIGEASDEYVEFTEE